MDKKNTIIGVLLLAAAFGTFFIGQKLSPPSQPQPARELSTTSSAPSQASSVSYTSPRDATFAAVKGAVSEAKTYALSNDFIEARFTNYGGAISEVALRKHLEDKARQDPYVLNKLHVAPMLAFTDLPGLDHNTGYDLVSKTDHEIVFRTVFENRVEVLRRYSVVAGSGSTKEDPYQIRYETVFRNLTDQTVQLPRALLSVGTSAPLNAADTGMYLSSSYNNGKSAETIKRSSLEGGGLMSYVGIGSRNPIPFIETNTSLAWASVENQFFVTLLTPDQPGSGLVTRRVELPAFVGSSVHAVGLTSNARFDVPALAPKAEARIGGQLYTGPKEYKRLSNSDIFSHDQDSVMSFGFFSFFSKILLTLMSWIHGIGPSWGWAIVLTTLLLKIVFLPLTLSASKSAKRMQKIQPEMQAVREKYKDNPAKLQQETMELFKKHKVNPMGGCLPILVTIPFFIGFFSMLQCTSELRFEEFLWATDLSAPDTVAHLFGFPINIMPVLMGATMVIQMHLTPQPTVDNAQAKMFKFMPYIFAIFCYGFSCALSLYSTVNGIFTILQQVIINRMKDKEGDAPVVEPSPRGRKMKNVTPGK